MSSPGLWGTVSNLLFQQVGRGQSAAASSPPTKINNFYNCSFHIERGQSVKEDSDFEEEGVTPISEKYQQERSLTPYFPKLM